MARSRLKKLFFRLLLAGGAAVLAFVVACLVVELYLFIEDPWVYQGRATAGNNPKSKVFDHRMGLCFEEDDALPFALIPGKYEIADGKRITINSLGYRGREFTRAKPPGKTRILFVGDSFTYGYGVDDEHTVPRLVEDRLREKLPNIEVINAGFHGSSLMQYDLFLREEGYALDPDMIVMLIFAGNDLADLLYNVVERYGPDGLPEKITDGLQSYKGRRYHASLPGWLYHLPGLDRSVLWDRLNRNIYSHVRHQRRKNITQEDKQRFFERSFVAIHNDCRRKGIRLYPVIVVGRWVMNGDAQPTEDYEFIRDFLASGGYDYLDLRESLCAHAADDLCIPPKDVHLNERGNAVVARGILSGIGPLLGGPGAETTMHAAADSPEM
jgi:hypothetical protein